MFKKIALNLIVLYMLLGSTAAQTNASGPKDKNAARPALRETPAIIIAGGPGKFDWMTVDPKRRRLLAAHTEKNSLEIINLDSEKPIASVKTGDCQGVAVGDKLYFAGDADQHKLVILDAESLKVDGEVKAPGPIDAITFNSRNHRVYAGHDDGADVWVIQPEEQKLLGTIPVHGVPEFIEYDRASNKLYQNIKTANTVAVIDPESNKIVSSWSTAPAQKPHGLAVDAKNKRLFTAGVNGILVAIDMKTGKVVSIVSIGEHVDQIAFDADKHRIYCACDSVISVVDASTNDLKLLENVPSHKGASSLSVDPKTHSVWISYADETDSYVQKFEFTP